MNDADQNTCRKAKAFLWYLEPPFNDPSSPHYFDRHHWWKSKDKSQDAALYELLRRHPSVGRMMQRSLQSTQGLPQSAEDDFAGTLTLKGLVPRTVRLDDGAIQCIAAEMIFFSLHSWPEITENQRRKFGASIRSVYPGKGRDLTKGVVEITKAAREMAESEKDVGGPTFEACLGDLASAYANQDRLVFAISSDFRSKREAESALNVLAKEFWKHWKKPEQSERAKTTNWLAAIETFELDFDLNGTAYFKLGYPKSFKRFIALFEHKDAQNLRDWWRHYGASQWAADEVLGHGTASLSNTTPTTS